MDSEHLRKLANNGKQNSGTALNQRLQAFSQEQLDYLTHLSVLNEHIDEQGISDFLQICGLILDERMLIEFLETGLLEYVIVPGLSEGEFIPFFKIEDRTQRNIWETLSEVEKNQRHIFADQFYRMIFAEILFETLEIREDSEKEEISDEDVTSLATQPGGFIDFGAHSPQFADLHNWTLTRAFYWQGHLFALKKFKEASDITNSICFTLVRKGHKQIAKEMLVRNSVVSQGLQKAVALTNLATILREEQEHKKALGLYRRVLPSLVRLRAVPQLAAVFSEMSNIHRDRGHLRRAIILQRMSSLMRSYLKDLKGKAICDNQLSILYRSLRLRKRALKYSRSAESYWRKTEDIVNLAKTLVTQGNIYVHMKQPEKALRCFDESLEINNRIGDLGEAASSLAGKARANALLKKYSLAKELLEEAISLRQRWGDRRIGIEYENMGHLYEEQGDFYLAIGWYKKALPQLEKYNPGFAPRCRYKIKSLQKRLR